MNEIEDAVGAPVASPEILAPIVGNMTNWDDDAPQLDQDMRSQLQHIAHIHGGRVPLHGRLFAQWLHYVFPRECPFPHKTGYSSSVTPSQFGDEYIATEEHVMAYAAMKSDVNVSNDATPWMSQWSEDEELIADYSAHLGRSSEVVRRIASACGASSLIVLIWAMWLKTNGGSDGSSCSFAEGVSFVTSPDAHKTHFV